MTEENVLYVSRNDIIKAGYEQYRDGEGVSHAMKIVDGRLEYEEGTSYYTDKSISAYDLCEVLEFQRPHPDEILGEEQPQDALQRIEVKTEVEIGDTTYEVRQR